MENLNLDLYDKEARLAAEQQYLEQMYFSETTNIDSEELSYSDETDADFRYEEGNYEYICPWQV